MRWFAIVCLCFVIWIGTVNNFLAFALCAIVSFIFVRNLFDSDIELDLTRIFSKKGPTYGKQNSNNGVTPESLPPSLAECRETAIKNVLRDFVVSWFQNVGVEEGFIVETRLLLEEATEKFYEKIARADVTSFAEKLCNVLHKHLASCQLAKAKLLQRNEEVDFVKAYQSLEGKPGIYQNNELPYLRTLVDLLLHDLVPKKTLGCDTGRFILREILAVDLFLPLLDSLSDSDFVNMSIINVFVEGRQDNEIIAHECNDLSESARETSPRLVERSEKKKTDSDLDFKRNSVDSTALSLKSTKVTVVEKNHGKNVDNSMKQNFSSISLSEASATNYENPRMKLKMNLGTHPTSNENCNLNMEQRSFISTSHVNQSITKADLGSENGKVLQDCVFSNPKIKFMMKTQTPPRCDENHGLFNEELSSHYATTSSVHQTLDKAKLENKNQKAPEETVSGSKVIHPGIMFSENLKCFDVSVEEHYVEKKTMQSLPEIFYSNGSVVDKQSTQSRSNDALNDFDLVSSCSPTKEDGKDIQDDVAEMNGHENQPFNKFSQDHSVSERMRLASSLEEIYHFDVSNGSKEDLPSMCDCYVIKDNRNDKVTEQKRSCLSVNGYDSGVKQPTCCIKSLSSSAEEWDTDMFQFEEIDGNDLSKDISDCYSSDLRESGQMDISSLGEFAIHEVENPYLMISIPSTELVDANSWESHIRKYTAYNIVFSLKLWPDQFTNDADSNTEQSDNTITERRISRRYREFMELHHRLSCGPHASYLKGIQKPNRKFNSPFFRFDLDVIEGRQHLLENYLKCLVNTYAILNSNDFKGFLGIGDQILTNFHRQMVEKVPRIDKKLRKEVNKLIDHIKTAFETGPIDGDKEEEYDDIRQVLGDDRTSQDEIRTFEICSGGCELHHSCCYSGKSFETFIQQKQSGSDTEHLGAMPGGQELTKDGRMNTKCVSSIAVKQSKPPTNYSKIARHKRSPVAAMSDLETKRGYPATYPLAAAVLNLSCEVFQKQESWVCLEPVQQAATAVFGRFFEWWFESLVNELITEEQWYHYLTLLTETIWPQGKLMNSKKVERTEEEKEITKEEAVQTLCDFFGGVIHCAIGSDAIKTSFREIVDSLQYQEINRQLLLEVLEVTLAEVFPGIVEGQEVYLSTRNCK